MKRLVFNFLCLFILQFFACADNSQNDKMVAYCYSPINQAVVGIYEIEFYDDGLIKTIKDYVNCKVADSPYDWDKSKCKLTETTEVVREGNIISVYVEDTDKGSEAVLKETYELLDDTTIVRTTLQNEPIEKDKIVLKDSIGSLEYYYKGEIAFTFTTKDKKSVWFHPKSGSITQYIFDSKGLFIDINYAKKKFTWDGEVTFDGKERYIVTQPSMGDPGPYLSKFDIIIPKIEYTAVSSALNVFLVPSNEMKFLLPFVTRTLIP